MSLFATPLYQLRPVTPRNQMQTARNDPRPALPKQVKMFPEPSTTNGITSLTAQNKEKAEPIMLTGTVERVIKWHRVYDSFCFYELIASVISIQEGTVARQKVMLMRDRKGPIMQVIYYESDRIEIDDFQIDQMLRCVGIMSGDNMFRAFKIRAATNEEISTLQRFCYLSDHTIAMLISK